MFLFHKKITKYFLAKISESNKSVVSTSTQTDISGAIRVFSQDIYTENYLVKNIEIPGPTSNLIHSETQTIVTISRFRDRYKGVSKF